MNTQQEDVLNMNYVLKNTCEKHQAIWATNPAFVVSYNLWGTKIPLIEQNRDAQMLEITGIKIEKEEKRAALIEKALFLENRLQSYANVENNHELHESVKYTASEMKKARDTEIIGICNTVLAKANANAGVLEPYGVTFEIISELQRAITDYSAILAKPKAAKSQTKTATQNLVKLFKEVDEILTKRLDLDIELFKVSNPDFYSQYKSARIVYSTKSSVTSVLGSVINASSGEPLKGVSFTFTSETTKPIVKKSAEKGKFRVSMPENTYQVVVEKIGYKKQDLTIFVAKGESTNLDIKLELL